MNGAFTNYLEQEVIEHLFHASNTYVPSAAGGGGTVYLGLLNAVPDDTGGTEVGYTNYQRQAITFNAAGTPARGIVQNGDVLFPQCGVTGDTATHWAVYDAQTVGNMLGYGALTASKPISNGNTPSVADGEVGFTASAGGMSDYLAEAILDFVFRNDPNTFGKPAKYLALATVDITSTMTGSTITEPAGNNYARKQVTVWTTGVNTAENTNEEQFNTPSGDWTAITATGICDALTLGNLLFFDSAPTGEGQAPGSGDTVKFAAGTFDVSID